MLCCCMGTLSNTMQAWVSPMHDLIVDLTLNDKEVGLTVPLNCSLGA